jgi:hypothetical protein
MGIDFSTNPQASIGRDEELKKWNTPKSQGGYRPDHYEPFPKMVYRGKADDGGKFILESQIVKTASDLSVAHGQGWWEGPDRAKDAYDAERAERGMYAAERAYTDRRMSEPAQREALTADAAYPGHMPEVPETKRGPGRPPKLRTED